MPSRRVRHGAARAADSFYHHLRRPFVGTRLDTEGMATRPRTSSATLTTSIAACASAEFRVASPNEPAVTPRATDSWQGAGFWSRTPKEEYPCECDRFGKRSPRKHGQRPSRRRLRLRRGPLPHHRATRQRHRVPLHLVPAPDRKRLRGDPEVHKGTDRAPLRRPQPLSVHFRRIRPIAGSGVLPQLRHQHRLPPGAAPRCPCHRCRHVRRSGLAGTRSAVVPVHLRALVPGVVGVARGRRAPSRALSGQGRARPALRSAGPEGFAAGIPAPARLRSRAGAAAPRAPVVPAPGAGSTAEPSTARRRE